jgi:hypothetical protein
MGLKLERGVSVFFLSPKFYFPAVLLTAKTKPAAPPNEYY